VTRHQLSARHFDPENAELAILNNLERLLGGETAINMNLKETPVAPDATAAQLALCSVRPNRTLATTTARASGA
jgi:hypothetical protein